MFMIMVMLIIVVIMVVVMVNFMASGEVVFGANTLAQKNIDRECAHLGLYDLDAIA